MLTNQDAIVIKSLKEEMLKRFEYFLYKLFQGYRKDYKDIINIICLIDLYEELKDTSTYYATKYL